MDFLTHSLRQRLLDNGAQQEKLKGTACEKDFYPVVKLFLPCSQATWLLTELDPYEKDIAFGLCDLGMGTPELGSVSLSELAAIKIHGLGVERDICFRADRPLSAYAKIARKHGSVAEASYGLSR